MTLIEALKSGKRFRRGCDTDWNRAYTIGLGYGTFGAGDIIEDDWEIESEPKPKLKAWMDKNKAVYMMRTVLENEACAEVGFVRLPHLDEL